MRVMGLATEKAFGGFCKRGGFVDAGLQVVVARRSQVLPVYKVRLGTSLVSVSGYHSNIFISTILFVYLGWSVSILFSKPLYNYFSLKKQVIYSPSYPLFTTLPRPSRLSPSSSQHAVYQHPRLPPPQLRLSQLCLLSMSSSTSRIPAVKGVSMVQARNILSHSSPANPVPLLFLPC